MQSQRTSGPSANCGNLCFTLGVLTCDRLHSYLCLNHSMAHTGFLHVFQSKIAQFPMKFSRKMCSIQRFFHTQTNISSQNIFQTQPIKH